MKYSKEQMLKSIKHWENLLESSLTAKTEELIDEAKMTREQYDDLLNKLQNGIVQFKFTKKDGTLRTAIGTLNPALMPTEEQLRLIYADFTDQVGNPLSYDDLMQKLHDRAAYMPYFWDLENGGYRQFHVSRFIEIVRSIETNSPGDIRGFIDNQY